MRNQHQICSIGIYYFEPKYIHVSQYYASNVYSLEIVYRGSAPQFHVGKNLNSTFIVLRVKPCSPLMHIIQTIINKDCNK